MRKLLALFFIFLSVFTIVFFADNPLFASEKVIKVAIIPWKLNAPDKVSYLKDALYDLTASRIGIEERLSVVEMSSIKRQLKTYGKELDDETLIEIGRNVKADYVFKGSLSFVEGTMSLDVKVFKVKGEMNAIFSVSQGKGLDSFIPLVDRMASDVNTKILLNEGFTPQVKTHLGAPLYGNVEKTSQAESLEGDDFLVISRMAGRTEKVWKSLTLSAALKGVTIGDFDGDGRRELAVIDAHNLWIYRRMGEDLNLLWNTEEELSVDNLFIDTADINGNGVSELYVSALKNDRLATYVIEYDGNGYKRIISDIPWFLRVVEAKGQKMLIGQKMRGKKVFSGSIKNIVWKGDQLSDNIALDLPRGVNIFGFSYADLNGSVGVASLDFDDYLRMYQRDGDKWEESWKSKERLGGTLNTIKIGPKGLNVSNSDNIKLVDVKGRIIFIDLNNDGTGEIIINKNISRIGRLLEKFRSFEKGEIVDYDWDGTSLEENWRTKTLDGYIADYQIDDVDNDGVQDLVIALVTDFNMITKSPKSVILSYRLVAKE